MSVTTEQLEVGKAAALARYLWARELLDAAIADEGAALRHWNSMCKAFGPGPGPAVDMAWMAWARAAEIREREAKALEQATAELQDAMRATAGGMGHG